LAEAIEARFGRPFHPAKFFKCDTLLQVAELLQDHGG